RAWERFDIHATIGLLSRAIELIPRDEPAGVPASIDLAAALTEAGEFARADAVLERAVRDAEAGSDLGLAARARVVRLYLSFWGPDTLSVDEARLSASDELTIAERTGDDVTGAWALMLLGGLSWSETRAEETRPAWRRAVDLFRQAGERHQAEDLISWLSSVPAWGPTPCDEALRQIEGFVDEVR